MTLDNVRRTGPTETGGDKVNLLSVQDGTQPRVLNPIGEWSSTDVSFNDHIYQNSGPEHTIETNAASADKNGATAGSNPFDMTAGSIIGDSNQSTNAAGNTRSIESQIAQAMSPLSLDAFGNSEQSAIGSLSDAPPISPIASDYLGNNYNFTPAPEPGSYVPPIALDAWA